MGRALLVSAASTTRRTIGLPSSFATSFVRSRPPAARKRDDLPAASTMAPMLVTGRAWLGTRTDLHKQAADAHRADVRVADGNAGQQALKPPVDAFLFRARGRARRPDDRDTLAFGKQQQIAGIDRHAEPFDASPDRFDGGSNDVAAIGERGGPEPK